MLLIAPIIINCILITVLPFFITKAHEVTEAANEKRYQLLLLFSSRLSGLYASYHTFALSLMDRDSENVVEFYNSAAKEFKRFVIFTNIFELLLYSYSSALQSIINYGKLTAEAMKVIHDKAGVISSDNTYELAESYNKMIEEIESTMAKCDAEMDKLLS